MPLQRRPLLLGSALAWLGQGCAPKAPSAVLNIEEGFVDIDLPVTNVQSNATGLVIVEARGHWEDQVIGVTVALQSIWKTQTDSIGLPVHWGRGAYRSIGVDSDNFVALLARQYGQAVSTGLHMLPEIDAEVVCLSGNPSRVQHEAIRTKFFFHSNSEDRYAEVYTNIDIPNSRLEFHEKDPEYRVNLIKALSET